MNELITQEADNLPLSPTQLKEQINTIQKVLRTVMKENVHFGIIPGTPKPTLYKAGAEKILATFRLCAEPEVEEVSGLDEHRFRVRIRLSAANGIAVGWGIGECSTSEEKYKWRRAICEQEFEEADEDRRRIKWKRGKNRTTYREQQIRTSIADLANTALKMAKKRALVDACLTTTAASDIFDQDLEDIDETQIHRADAPREPIQQPQAKAASEPAPTPAGTDLITGPQSKLIFAKLHNASLTPDEFCKEFGILKVVELPRDLINGALEWIQKMTPVNE